MTSLYRRGSTWVCSLFWSLGAVRKSAVYFTSFFFFLEKLNIKTIEVGQRQDVLRTEHGQVFMGMLTAGTFVRFHPPACFPLLSEFLVRDLGQLCNPSDAAVFLFPNAIRVQGTIATDDL